MSRDVAIVTVVGLGAVMFLTGWPWWSVLLIPLAIVVAFCVTFAISVGWHSGRTAEAEYQFEKQMNKIAETGTRLGESLEKYKQSQRMFQKDEPDKQSDS